MAEHRRRRRVVNRRLYDVDTRSIWADAPAVFEPVWWVAHNLVAKARESAWLGRDPHPALVPPHEAAALRRQGERYRGERPLEYFRTAPRTSRGVIIPVLPHS